MNLCVSGVIISQIDIYASYNEVCNHVYGFRITPQLNVANCQIPKLRAYIVQCDQSCGGVFWLHCKDRFPWNPNHHHNQGSKSQLYNWCLPCSLVVECRHKIFQRVKTQYQKVFFFLIRSKSILDIKKLEVQTKKITYETDNPNAPFTSTSLHSVHVQTKESPHVPASASHFTFTLFHSLLPLKYNIKTIN